MKLTKVLLLIMFCLSCATTVFAQSADDLTYMTEQYPPFNFSENSEASGINVDLLIKMFEQMGVNKTRADIQVIPWAKGYEAVKTTPGSVLFGMSRTEAREPLFKWVGPISPSRIGLIAKKSDGIKINSYSDLTNYKIGAVRDDIGEQLLLQNGVPTSAIDASSTMEANIKKLDRGRINLWSYNETVAGYAFKAAGLNSADYETVFILNEGYQSYAFHKGTDDALIQKFQAALDAVKASGELQKILSKFGQ